MTKAEQLCALINGATHKHYSEDDLELVFDDGSGVILTPDEEGELGGMLIDVTSPEDTIKRGERYLPVNHT